jgi:hypothetical protein
MPLRRREGLLLLALLLALALGAARGVAAVECAVRPLATCASGAVAKAQCVVSRGACVRRKGLFFAGNSFTFVNKLPSMLATLATRASRPVRQSSFTKGGLRLYDHFYTWNTSGLASAYLAGSNVGDVLLLQDQSQHLALGSAFWTTWSKPPTSGFTARGSSDGYEAMLWMTWGYSNGDRDNFGDSDSYAAMQDRISAGYRGLAAATGASLCEVGEVWRKVYDHLVASGRSVQVLYQEKLPLGKHPAVLGTFVAATSLYTCLFDQSAVGQSWRPKGVSAEDAALVRRLAAETLLPP